MVSDPPGYDVFGFVTADARPVANAKVYFGRKQATTDAHGFYLLRDVPIGVSLITARGPENPDAALLKQDVAVLQRSGETRIDLELFDAVLELRDLPVHLDGQSISIFNAGDEVKPNPMERPIHVARVEERSLRVTGLRPGRYRLRTGDGIDQPRWTGEAEATGGSEQ